MPPHFRLPAAVSGALFALAASLAQAQAWPEHQIKLVVPFGPGGANDLIARVAAEGLSKRLGQPVIIENKPGAGAVIGADFVAKSKPDGYTFLIGAMEVVTNKFLRRSMPYADTDLIPVGMIAIAPPVIVVHPSLPVNTMKEFVAYAKSKGAKGISFSTAGSGSTPHFVAEMLKDATGASFNIIPYKSEQEGLNAVIDNQATATSEASIAVIPQIKGGKLKAIATTYDKRITSYMTIPTTAEEGYRGVTIGHWAGLFAPRNTPQAILEKINTELQAVLKTTEIIDRLIPAGIEPAGGSLASFVEFIKNERERLEKVAKKAGMAAE